MVIGVLHIGLANAMMAYVNRHKRTAVASLGWIAAITGGLLVWLGAPGTVWETAGPVMVGGGLLAVLLFSSDRPVNKPADHAWRLLDGVQRLGGVMGAFGDVLSYMRLFALGLASASLAVTFNDLAKDAYQALPGLGLLAAVLIIAIGGTCAQPDALADQRCGPRAEAEFHRILQLGTAGGRNALPEVRPKGGGTVNDFVLALGWIGIYSPMALGAIGSAIGSGIAGQASIGAMLETEGGYGRYIGMTAFPRPSSSTASSSCSRSTAR